MANRWGRTAVAALLAVATVDAHAEPVITSVYVSFNKATHLLAQNDGRCSLWVRGGELVFSQPREAVAKVKLDSSYPVRVDRTGYVWSPVRRPWRHRVDISVVVTEGERRMHLGSWSRHRDPEVPFVLLDFFSASCEMGSRTDPDVLARVSEMPRPARRWTVRFVSAAAELRYQGEDCGLMDCDSPFDIPGWGKPCITLGNHCDFWAWDVRRGFRSAVSPPTRDTGLFLP